MKIGAFMRCLIPICFGSLFIMAGVRRIHAMGPQLFPVGFCVIGAFTIAVGIYYGLFRLEFRDGGFIAYPGRRRYRMEDVVAWWLNEHSGAKAGRRYLELQFDKWYRRYMLFEEDLSPAVFEDVLRFLRRAKQHPGDPTCEHHQRPHDQRQ